MSETGLYLWGSLDYVPCLTGHSTSANPYYQLWILKLSLLNKSAYYKIHILDNHFDFCCSFSSGFLFMLGQLLKYPLLEHIWKLYFYLKWNKFKSLLKIFCQVNRKIKRLQKIFQASLGNLIQWLSYWLNPSYVRSIVMILFKMIP